MTTSDECLAGLFRRSVQQAPDALAILTDPVWTYRSLDQASDAVAAGLMAEGLAAGERVALLCPNGPEFVIVYLALLKSGAVIVPLNLLLTPAAMAFQLNDCGCVGLVAHSAFADAAIAALAEAPSVRLRLAIGDDERLGPLRLDAWLAAAAADPVTASATAPATAQAATASAAAPPPLVEVSPDADAVILYTSGTTGRPKGAVLTHANLASNASAVAQVLGFEPGRERVLVVLPMFHAFAGTVGILTPLLSGAALIPVPRFDPHLITEHVAWYQATVFLGVPSLYAALMRLPDAEVSRWSRVRLCISGGAAMPQALMERFEQRFGLPILEGDGPTECGPVTCVNPPAGPRKPASIGPPIPGVEVCVMDDNGQPLPDGEHGEVCVRGPSVMRGYWNLPEATAESFFGNWFRTGDLGWRDADGWFYLVDRIKDLIITNGMNVYPRIVEEALMRHPAVAEVAVVGEPHPSHGEIVVAHLVAAPDETIDVAALKAWCREHLGRHEQPRRVELRDALPKNAAGKTLKRELRRAGETERGIG